VFAFAACAAPSIGFGQAVASREAARLPARPAEPAQPRKLAPGVEQTIPVDNRPTDVISRHDLVEILAESPSFGVAPNTSSASPAKGVRFVQDVRGLNFSFKPLRMIQVDVPTPSGRMQRKLVWYMVFHVTNPSSDKPFKFAPQFWLDDLDKHVTYSEKLIPVAIPLIRRREDPHRTLLNTVEISGEIGPGQDVWGVVTWDDLDPTMKHFSMFVQGLSNAYKWQDPEGAYKQGDAPGTGRKILEKTLQLNFWRPADPFYEHESEIRYGIPGDVDYRWVYR
jgi:hypothetical protein